MNLRVPVMGAVATLALVLTACGSSGSGGGSDSAGASTPDSLIAKFKAAGLPVGSTYKVTASNDPNHLLGRPNGYVAKTAWTDTRINPRDDSVRDTTAGSVDLGGSIEQFRSPEEAKNRADYISAFQDGSALFGSEYHYLVGSSLIRVSGILTPRQARAYKSAAER